MDSRPRLAISSWVVFTFPVLAWSICLFRSGPELARGCRALLAALLFFLGLLVLTAPDLRLVGELAPLAPLAPFRRGNLAGGLNSVSSLPRGLFRLSSTGLDSLLSWMMDTEDVAEGEQGREISWTDWIEIGEEDPEEITTGDSREPEPGKALDTAGDGTLGPLFLTLDLALCELADEGAVVGL